MKTGAWFLHDHAHSHVASFPRTLHAASPFDQGWMGSRFCGNGVRRVWWCARTLAAPAAREPKRP